MEGSEVDTKKRKHPEESSPHKQDDNKAYYDIYGPSAKPEIELKLGFKNCMKIRVAYSTLISLIKYRISKI